MLAGLIFLMLNVLVELGRWQKLEIFCVAAGVAVLIASDLGMVREKEQRSDLVSFGLWLGSLLTALPLFIALIYYRFFGASVSLPNELGLLTATIILLVTGYIFQIKSTTLVGGTLLVIHLAVLVVSAGQAAQLAVGAYLAIGGTLLFAFGIGLSIYRERLLSLPERIARREGIFRVIGWR